MPPPKQRWRTVNTAEDSLPADGTAGRERIKWSEEHKPYRFESRLNMTGTTNEPWRNRIRTANAAYRNTGIQQIIALRKTCCETVAYMYDKLPEELIVMVLKECVLACCPRMASPEMKLLQELLHAAVRSLFAITGVKRDPPAALLKHATDVTLVTSTFCLHAPHTFDKLRGFGATYGNVRHVVLLLPLQDIVVLSRRVSYPTDLHRTARDMSLLAARMPRVETFCLEIGYTVTGVDITHQIGWVEFLDAPCRKGLKETSTFGAEIRDLIQKLIDEGPGLKKSVKMTLTGRQRPGMEVDVGSLASAKDEDSADTLAERVLRAATGGVEEV
nr:hypothetical protein B0A51_03604 [Rachicladosporium sp. CCFEE 5018]